MNLLGRDEFIKASPAIQIQNNLTHLQRRAWNVLLANAYDYRTKKYITSALLNLLKNSGSTAGIRNISKKYCDRSQSAQLNGIS